DDPRLSFRVRGGGGGVTPFPRMVLGGGITFLGFKTLTMRRLAFGRAVGYWAFLPGRGARPLAAAAPRPDAPPRALGLVKMAAGALLLFLPVPHSDLDVLRIFAGIGLLVHFGLCDVLAGFWRMRGVAVERLFVNPLASKTLGEFWGRRWNLAFHAVARE